MRKFLIILSLFVVISTIGQVTPKTPFNIPDNNTAFGINVPEGSYVYDVATDSVWILNAVGTTTTTLRTATKTLISPVNSSTVDHGSLNGLTDDDHHQYALLNGRAGDKLVIDTIERLGYQLVIPEAMKIIPTVGYEAFDLNIGEHSGISYNEDDGFLFYSQSTSIYLNGESFWSGDGISLGYDDSPFLGLYSANIKDNGTSLRVRVPYKSYDSLLVIHNDTIGRRPYPVEVDAVVGNEGDTTKHHTVGYGLDGTFYNQTANQTWKVDTTELTTPYYVKKAIHDSLDGLSPGGGWVGTATSDLNMNDYNIDNVDSLEVEEAFIINGLTIIDPTPASDHTATGNAIYGTAGETLAFGDIVYQKAADGELYKADATSTAKMLVRYFVLASGSDGGSVLVLKDGFVRDDSWSWTVGANNLLYAAAGSTAITQTAPTGADDVIQVLGIPYSATVIEWKPEFSNLELY